MNPSQTIEVTMWGAILLKAIGAVDPETGNAYMPAPAGFVAIVVTWTILGFASGTRFARGAAAMSVVMVLATLVLGGAGAKLTNLLNTLASQYGSSGPSTLPPSSTTTNSTVPTGAAATGGTVPGLGGRRRLVG